MTGMWSPWYSHHDPPQPYGDQQTYHVAEQWLRGLDVEDWGCGYGWYKNIHTGGYLGVDGTAGYADVVQDLTQRRSQTPGLLLRHVLEHNWSWRDILRAADASCTDTLVIVTFTPPAEVTTQIGWNEQLRIPDLSLPHDQIAEVCPQWVDYVTDTQYRSERVYVRRHAQTVAQH